MLTHGNLMHNSALIKHLFDQSQRTGRVSSGLPSYHDMGLIGGILQPMFISRPNILMSPVAFLQRPLRWLQAISRYHVPDQRRSEFRLRPVRAEDHPRATASPRLDLLALAFNGAEPVRAETIDRFCEAFGPYGFRREAFYPCYGLAEATLIVSGGYKDASPSIRDFLRRGSRKRHTPLPRMLRRPSLGWVGRKRPGPADRHRGSRTIAPLPGRQNWRSVGQGAQHRAGVLESPGRDRTSLSRPTCRPRAKGRFCARATWAFFDRGELFITGRLKDLIIVRGLNHYPNDIELTVEKRACGYSPQLRRDIHRSKTMRRQISIIVCEVERRGRGKVDAIIDAIRREVLARARTDRGLRSCC